MLGSHDTIVARGLGHTVLSLIKELVAQKCGGDGEEAAYANGEEDETRLLCIEVVNCAENVRKGSEEGKQNSKVESNV